MKRIVVKGKEVVLKVLHRPEYLDSLIRHFEDLIQSDTECKQFLKECENDQVENRKTPLLITTREQNHRY